MERGKGLADAKRGLLQLIHTDDDDDEAGLVPGEPSYSKDGNDDDGTNSRGLPDAELDSSPEDEHEMDHTGNGEARTRDSYGYQPLPQGETSQPFTKASSVEAQAVGGAKPVVSKDKARNQVRGKSDGLQVEHGARHREGGPKVPKLTSLFAVTQSVMPLVADSSQRVRHRVDEQISNLSMLLVALVAWSMAVAVLATESAWDDSTKSYTKAPDFGHVCDGIILFTSAFSVCVLFALFKLYQTNKHPRAAFPWYNLSSPSGFLGEAFVILLCNPPGSGIVELRLLVFVRFYHIARLLRFVPQPSRMRKFQIGAGLEPKQGIWIDVKGYLRANPWASIASLLLITTPILSYAILALERSHGGSEFVSIWDSLWAVVWLVIAGEPYDPSPAGRMLAVLSAVVGVVLSTIFFTGLMGTLEMDASQDAALSMLLKAQMELDLKTAAVNVISQTFRLRCATARVHAARHALHEHDHDPAQPLSSSFIASAGRFGRDPLHATLKKAESEVFRLENKLQVGKKDFAQIRAQVEQLEEDTDNADIAPTVMKIQDVGKKTRKDLGRISLDTTRRLRLITVALSNLSEGLLGTKKQLSDFQERTWRERMQQQQAKIEASEARQAEREAQSKAEADNRAEQLLADRLEKHTQLWDHVQQQPTTLHLEEKFCQLQDTLLGALSQLDMQVTGQIALGMEQTADQQTRKQTKPQILRPDADADGVEVTEALESTEVRQLLRAQHTQLMARLDQFESRLDKLDQKIDLRFDKESEALGVRHSAIETRLGAMTAESSAHQVEQLALLKVVRTAIATEAGRRKAQRTQTQLNLAEQRKHALERQNQAQEQLKKWREEQKEAFVLLRTQLARPPS